MRSFRALFALLGLAAAAACSDSSTAPTDQDLLGTWTIQPSEGVLPGGGTQQLTVSFGPNGAFSLETATYGDGGMSSNDLLAYNKSFGSITAAGGELTLHPTGSMSVDRRWSPRGPAGPIDVRDLEHPVGYQVVGNHLFLRLPPLSPHPVVMLTRRDP
jgi:hypothetical protein